MKTIVVYQLHPFKQFENNHSRDRANRIIVRAHTIRTEGADLEIVPDIDQMYLPEGITSFPDSLRRIVYAHYEMETGSNLAVRGGVLTGKRIEFVSVDIFFCNDNAEVSQFIK